MSKSLLAGLFASATGTGTAGYTGESRFAIDPPVLSGRSLIVHRHCSALSEQTVDAIEYTHQFVVRSSGDRGDATTVNCQSLLDGEWPSRPFVLDTKKNLS
jgi:hypothetical protein